MDEKKYTLDDIETLRSKTGVGYEEAVALLEKYDGDIARALARDAALILADGPTGNLASKTGADVMKLFHELHEAGNTIVLITHDAKIAAQTPRAIHIHDGKVLEPMDESEVVI